MKKLLCLSLALTLLLCCCPALADIAINMDSTWPVTSDPMSVTIGIVPQNRGEYDLDNVWTLNYLKEMSGLDITWKHIDKAAAKEQIPLMMAGDTMPDAVMGWYSMNASRIVQYGVDEQMLYPIDELLEYMPNFSALLENSPQMRAAITASDGHIYGVPNMSDGTNSYILRWFINSRWLKNVDKSIPTTLDEMYDVLVAFKTQDANGNGAADDEIPVGEAWNEGYALRAWILNAYGFCTTGSNTALYYPVDGEPEVRYIPYTAEYKEYLTYMKKLWDAGLLDLDMFTQTQAQVDAKIADDRVGFAACSAPEAVDPSKEFDWDAAQPLTSALSAVPIQPRTAAVSHPALMFLNSNCTKDKAAALAKFADCFFDVDMYNLFQMGPEFVEGEAPAMTAQGPQYMSGYGVYFNPETKACDWVFDSANYSSAWAWRTTALTPWAFPGYSCNGNDAWTVAFGEKYPDSAIGKYVNGGMAQETWRLSADKYQTPYARYILHALYYSVADMGAVNETVTLMDDYVAGVEAKFITGEMSIEKDYDSFISTLESYGVTDYTNTVNAYYGASK